MNTSSRTIEIDNNPSSATVLRLKSVLLRNGVRTRQDVISLATYGVSPLSVVTAAAQLAVTFDCPMGCGRKLDPGNKDAMGVDLCPTCYDEAGLENEHSDGYHDDEPVAECPGCTCGPEMRPAAYDPNCPIDGEA